MQDVGKRHFVFLDPPYFAATDRNDYYIHSFTEDDHLSLKEACDEIDASGGKFMLSYDDRPEIWQMYKFYFIDVIPINAAGFASLATDINITIPIN